MFESKTKKKMYTHVNPSFTIQKWGLLGYSLHGIVFMMRSGEVYAKQTDVRRRLKMLSKYFMTDPLTAEISLSSFI